MKADVVARRALVNTVSSSAAKAVRLAAGFLLTPLILHKLGAADYGLWVLAGAVSGYGTLLDFGIGSAVVKYVAEYQAKDDLAQLRSVIATALCLYLALAAVAVGATFVAAPFFAHWFHLTDPRATTLLILMGCGVALALPCGTAAAVLSGLHRFDAVSALSVLSTLLHAGSTVAVLLSGGGLVGLVLVGTAVPLVVQAPAIWLVRRLAPGVRFGLGGASRRLMQRLASFSSSMFLMDLSGRLLSRTDELVIARFLPLAAISPYALARTLSEVPQMLTDQFLRVLLPLASEADAANDQARLRSLFLSGTRISLACLLAIGCPLLVLPDVALSLWVGAAFGQYGYLVVLLTVSSVLGTSSWPAGAVLQGMARHRPVAIVSVVQAVASVALSIALAPRFGLAGVAVGTLAPVALGCLGVLLPYAMRTLGVGLRELITGAVLKPAAAGLCAAAACALARHWLEPMTIFDALASGAVAAAVFGGVYFLIAGDSAECRHVLRLARQALTSSRWQRPKVSP